MPRIMRDSTTWQDIPAEGTQLVAGYIDGRYAWDAAGWERWAHVPRATIAIDPAHWWTDILDVEAGDATNAGALAWVREKHAHRLIYPPILYTSRDNLTPMFNTLAAGGFHVGDGFRLGIATLDGTEQVADMTGVTFVQARGEAQTGGHYDESLVYDDHWFPGMPHPAPRPPAQQPRDGVVVELPSGTVLPVQSTDGGVTWRGR